jgi:hypothetical protein
LATQNHRDQIKDNDKKVIAGLYKEGFIHAYNKVMLICSALAFLGALMSFLFIQNKKLRTDALKN